MISSFMRPLTPSLFARRHLRYLRQKMEPITSFKFCLTPPEYFVLLSGHISSSKNNYLDTDFCLMFWKLPYFQEIHNYNNVINRVSKHKPLCVSLDLNRSTILRALIDQKIPFYSCYLYSSNVIKKVLTHSKTIRSKAVQAKQEQGNSLARDF